MKKPAPKDVLKIIQEAIATGEFDWTSQNGIIIYTPANTDITNIIVDFKVTQ